MGRAAIDSVGPQDQWGTAGPTQFSVSAHIVIVLRLVIHLTNIHQEPTMLQELCKAVGH